MRESIIKRSVAFKWLRIFLLIFLTKVNLTKKVLSAKFPRTLKIRGCSSFSAGLVQEITFNFSKYQTNNHFKYLYLKITFCHFLHSPPAIYGPKRDPPKRRSRW